MYEVKPILYKFDISIPKCMYEMKPLIQNQCNGFEPKEGVDVSDDSIIRNLGEQIRLCLKETSIMSDVEARQLNLLKQLENLKNKLLEIRSEMGFEKIDNSSKLETEVQKEVLNDIVVNSSPDCIPYGLLALKNAWKDILNINVTTHLHSSISILNKEAKEFEEKITKRVDVSPNSPTINIVLIWKNSEHTEMITSFATYVPIYGEVNILRYLARIGPMKYRYENELMCNEMDAVLDISYQLPCCCGNKTKSQLLKSLSGRLEKRKYFGGDNWSIADIGAYSALKRSLWLTQKDLTENLSKWFERIKSLTKI